MLHGALPVRSFQQPLGGQPQLFHSCQEALRLLDREVLAIVVDLVAHPPERIEARSKDSLMENLAEECRIALVIVDFVAAPKAQRLKEFPE